ncbi:MAG: hypothetical protein M3R38_07250 [Actinomycetota bacterium]|nr:hypothetical protein [Actinomycetota bacterium]
MNAEPHSSPGQSPDSLDANELRQTGLADLELPAPLSGVEVRSLMAEAAEDRGNPVLLTGCVSLGHV